MRLRQLDAILSLDDDVPTCFYVALTVYPARALKMATDAVLCALEGDLQAGGDRLVVKLDDVSVTPLWTTTAMRSADGGVLHRFVIPP